VYLSLFRSSWELNIYKFNNNKNNNTNQEPDTLKKSEVATSDDKTSKNTIPKAQVHVTSTPAKAREERSRKSPIHQKDQPNKARPLKRKKAFHILKRLATNPIREDQTSKLDYQKIQEDIAWVKEVILDFDIGLTTSNSNKRDSSMEAAQSASKKDETTNRGTKW